ncbi:50S ribosomal protein L29 [Blattabacterium cuenoti]|uniref:50S ribosomal protein L29 n=1 Tax=Blattabacterium cuenoti TaxID=1653831 RepID=UPI00163BF15F|nr:50S ribosomal protein L29 [Blattabacterium cuenoti]
MKKLKINFLSIKSLKKLIQSSIESYKNLKLNIYTKKLKKSSDIKILRRNIARLKTELNEKLKNYINE